MLKDNKQLNKSKVDELVSSLKSKETQEYINCLVNEHPDKLLTSVISAAYSSFMQDDKHIIIGENRIPFKADMWDFSKIMALGKSPYLYKYYFAKRADEVTHLNKYYEFILKFYTLYLIYYKGIHAGGNKNMFRVNKNFLFWLQDHDLLDFNMISEYDIESFITSSETDYNTQIKKKYNIKDFLSFLTIVFNYSPSQEIKNYLNDINLSRKKAIIENNKTPLLPTSFYKKMAKVLWNAAHDKTIDRVLCGIYGLLYIACQTGIRASEVTMLRMSDVVKIDKYNMKGYILTYRTTKSARITTAKDVTIEGQTAISEDCYKVYRMLEEEFKEEREILKTDLLVPDPNGHLFAISSSRLMNELKDLLMQHADELNLYNRSDASRFDGVLSIREKTKFHLSDEEASKYSLPTLKQFRVYVYTDLHNRNISDQLISLMFAHQTQDMVGYYYRNTNKVQEDIEFSKETLKEIVEQDLNILGPKGNLYNEKINGYIEEYGGQLNIANNLDDIIAEACDEIPIRKKAVGFCAKSNPGRECRMDADTDRFNCAMGMCPNHCLLYFYLPQVYKICEQEFITIEYNQKNNMVNATQKSAYVLDHHITHELMQVLEEFKSETGKQGKDAIIKQHPELKECYEKIDEMERNIELWKKTVKNINNSVKN